MTRILQVVGVYSGYREEFQAASRHLTSFEEKKKLFLEDCFGAPHILKPVYDDPDSAFLSVGDCPDMQRAWAIEHGMPADTSLEDILAAQVEHHRPEVFYNLDPVRFGGDFVSRLPSCVKRKIAWRAAPGTVDLGGYDMLVCNFPSILDGYSKLGIRTGMLYPAHDPALDDYAANNDRDIDILFVGGYTRHHTSRNKILSALASLSGRYRVKLHLVVSKHAWIAGTPLRFIPALGNLAPPRELARISSKPVFARRMYQQLGRARIVVNAAIDMSGADRGNMRCFETMGARSLLLTDQGKYPPGMIDGETMMTYANADDLVAKIRHVLESGSTDIANAGFQAVRTQYSREKQLSQFLTLVS